ncbi:hypothetical protein L1785_16775 [Antribacter sp. KLBMP9083]|uniref:Uncharacterized protein n=1 Tax=Antribacter soli TaxID=2910976 RepID=A0AA41QIB0_9MICO|nr:hypothetical protein [Antribacter soli]MCF4122634.1 hypothetical protein [Antribacter soli]
MDRRPTDEWAFLLPPGWARFPAGEAAAGVVYLPVEPMEGMIIPASITETELFGVVGRSPVEVATSVLGDGYDESEPVELDGRPGVRATNTRHEVEHAGDRPAVITRQVAYVVSRDEADGDWLVLSFSTVWDSPDTERLAEALVLFFDAVMTTFRWTGPGLNPVNLRKQMVPGSASRRLP